MRLKVAAAAAAEGISPQAYNKRLRKLGIKAQGGTVDAAEVKRRFEGGKNILQQQRGTAAKRKTAPAPVAGKRQRGGGLVGQMPALQAAREAVRLKSDQIKLKQLEGSLIDAEEAEAEFERRTRDDAEALLNWPGRVSAEMAAELGIDERKLHALLDTQIRVFMRERSMVALSV